MGSLAEADVLIAGVGHPLMGDDSLGLEVLRLLEEEHRPVYSRLFYAGSSPLDILGELHGIKKLIVIDAFTGVPPGEILRKRFAADHLFCENCGADSHGIGLSQTLAMARELMPDMDIVLIGMGIEPTAVPGSSLSQLLRKRIPKLIEIIKEEIFSALSNPSRRPAVP